MSELDLEVVREDARVRVALRGELDISEVGRVEQELAEIERDKPALIVIDLRGLSFIDSSGLRLVLEADQRARRDARRVELIPGPEQVHRVFLIALLDKRLEFVEPGAGDGGTT